MWRTYLLCLLGAFVLACSSSGPVVSTDRSLEETVTALANEMAANASALDVRANLPLIPRTDKVVYVSDGVPITGTEYARELAQSYATRSRLSFRWDRLEITPIGATAAAVTGWASTSVTRAGGQTVNQRYIFTMVFAKEATGWKRILAQKAVLKED